MLIPKFSGDQYNAGRHIPPSQAKRGDLIFYGPGGSQHVAMYLGNGQMLEASGSAGKVTVSPVRTRRHDSRILTRIIEILSASAELSPSDRGRRRRIPNCLE